MNKIIPTNHHPLPAHAKKVFHGNRFRVYQWEQELFDGTKDTYESVEKDHTVVIFPIVDGKIGIVEEEQPHWGRKGTNVIAGGVEDGEDIIEAAKRELREETGMVFENLYHIASDQHLKDLHWHVHCFVATNFLETGEKDLDPGERSETKFVSFDRLIEMARKREFYHRPALLDEYIIRDEIEKLRDTFAHPEKYTIES